MSKPGLEIEMVKYETTGSERNAFFFFEVKASLRAVTFHRRPGCSMSAVGWGSLALLTKRKAVLHLSHPQEQKAAPPEYLTGVDVKICYFSPESSWDE